MSYDALNINKAESLNLINQQIEKGETLFKKGYSLIEGKSKYSVSSRDRDLFESTFKQWVDITYSTLFKVYKSSKYAMEFKEKHSSKVEYVNSSWIPDIEYYLSKQFVQKLDYLKMLRDSIDDFKEENDGPVTVERKEQMKQLTPLAFINPNRRWVVRELNKLLSEWETWSKDVDQITDQPYDHNTQTEVFADGELMMQKHEILQSRTLIFLNNNISGHGFITGLDGHHCDRTDLRLKHRVKHRLQELYVLHACLETLPRQIGSIAKNSISSEDRDVWQDIKNDYGMDKRAFGKNINFIIDAFKRKIIFRDIEQAYILAGAGFSKPAVILAGGVIEELLRLYLHHKNIKPLKNDFDGYIKTCENNGLLN